MDIKVLDNFQLSFNDFKKESSILIHVPTCNLKCKYCFNMPIFPKNKVINFKKNLFPKINKYLEKNRLNKNITISGGEPTLQNNLISILKFLKEQHDYNIMLYTNGTNPEIIKDCIPYIKYIAIDIKTPLIDIYKNNNNFNFKTIAYMLFGKSNYLLNLYMLNNYINIIKESLNLLITNKFYNIELRTTFNDILINNKEQTDIILLDFITVINDYLNAILKNKKVKLEYFIQKAISTEETNNEYTQCTSDLNNIFNNLDLKIFNKLQIKIR